MSKSGNIKCWIEAMRLRTLPVSVAGVFAASGFALDASAFKWLPALLCLIFAVLAQIASNFANEYYDFKAGLDRPGRVGPRRGVTEGDITPRAMCRATFGVLALACIVGLSLVFWGGWWLILAGIIIALAVLAYSTGPYPLSRHALGEVAVIIFFGIIPVNLTFYIQAGFFSLTTFMGSMAIGLMGADVLLVNNYRDADDDRASGKTTLAVKFGRRFSSTLYLINGWLAVTLMTPYWLTLPLPWLAVPAVFLFLHTTLWLKVMSRSGVALNPLLGMTAVLMLAYSIGVLLSAA